MKRIKRNKSQRAFQRGYQVGLSGRSKAICPFEESKRKASWLEGWDTGNADHQNGLTGISALQNIGGIYQAHQAVS